MDFVLMMACFSVKNQLRDKTLSVKGDQWPIFVYEDHRFDPDNAWTGLFRGRLLLNVS